MNLSTDFCRTLIPHYLFPSSLQSSNQQPHEEWMKKALQLAAQGYGFTRPNPMVGALILWQQQIIAQGYHAFFGEAHAEKMALQNFALSHHQKLDTLVCTLEPCLHTHKKTPPCLPLILEKPFKKMIIGTVDPNPNVAEKSIKQFMALNGEVIYPVLAAENTFLNRFYFKSLKLKRPYIHLKMATSSNQHFSWGDPHLNRTPLTNITSRSLVHWIRAGVDAILVGGETIRTDNPQLNVRLAEFQHHPKFRHPKIFIASQKLTPQMNYQLLQTTPPAQIISLGEKISRQHLQEVLQALYEKQNICSLLIEAGPLLQSRFLEYDLYDELSLFVAPHVTQGGLFFDLNPWKTQLQHQGGQWYDADGDQLFHYVKSVI